jgi:hypothetical protein
VPLRVRHVEETLLPFSTTEPSSFLAWLRAISMNARRLDQNVPRRAPVGEDVLQSEASQGMLVEA